MNETAVSKGIFFYWKKCYALYKQHNIWVFVQNTPTTCRTLFIHWSVNYPSTISVFLFIQWDLNRFLVVLASLAPVGNNGRASGVFSDKLSGELINSGRRFMDTLGTALCLDSGTGPRRAWSFWDLSDPQDVKGSGAMTWGHKSLYFDHS